MKIPSHINLGRHLILGCQISGIFDVNRNEVLPNDDFSIIEPWANSIKNLGLQAIIFHNNYSASTVFKFQSNHLIFIKIDYDICFKPNVYRYFVYLQFLKKYSSQIDSFFVTDVSDVIVQKNPFIQPLFLENSNCIFCGDEPTTLNNSWMINHNQHLRNKINDFAKIEYKFKNQTLLNCGIIGGTTVVMHPFLRSLWQVHKKYNIDNQTLFTGDMGAFNYILRKKYKKNILHGSPINSEFKAYFDNGLNWFMHK